MDDKILQYDEIGALLIENLEQVKFVDKIIFGRMHYNKQVSAFEGYKDIQQKIATIS